MIGRLGLVCAVMLCWGLYATPAAAQRGVWLFTLRDTTQATHDSTRVRLLKWGADSGSLVFGSAIVRFTTSGPDALNAIGDSLDAGAFKPFVRRGMQDRVRMLPPDTARFGLPQSVTLDWGVTAIHADSAWKLGARGCGVIGADIDTGFGPNPHAVIAGWTPMNYNYPGGIATLDSSLANSLWDQYTHGTHTGGTMAADTTSGVGVAPCARLWIYKGDDTTSPGGIWGHSVTIAADELLHQPQKFPAPVVAVNMSFGFSSTDIFNAPMQQFVAAGIVPCAAMGNDGGAGVAPGRFPPAIGNSAIDGTGAKAGFSSYGPNTTFALPGVNTNSLMPGGGFGVKSGTSMATPHCSGAVMVVCSVRIDLCKPSAAPVVALLCATADPLGAASDPGMPGHDDFYGCGRINLARAVTRACVDGPCVPYRTPATCGTDAGCAGCATVNGTLPFVATSDTPWMTLSITGRQLCWTTTGAATHPLAQPTITLRSTS